MRWTCVAGLTVVISFCVRRALVAAASTDAWRRKIDVEGRPRVFFVVEVEPCFLGERRRGLEAAWGCLPAARDDCVEREVDGTGLSCEGLAADSALCIV